MQSARPRKLQSPAGRGGAGSRVGLPPPPGIRHDSALWWRGRHHAHLAPPRDGAAAAGPVGRPRTHGFYARDAGVAHRTNLGLLRQIICQESTKFKNVWTTHSASPIAYERGRIYLDNYQCCISSIAQEPRILYQKPKCSKSEKIEDALLLECPLGEMLPSLSDYKSSLIVLTVQNWLLRLSADSGEVLEKIYLTGSCCKFSV
uniref:DDB1 and CUL4 associated factor 17 n=1 Tax=Amazona collaria TaxID=241587 RepID=A0A8B9IYU5_9PSIT